jgi:fumarate reductase flavoprotein subunit
MDADVVIVGGGLAGLVAANRAAELGLKPIVLEQGAGPEYLCNSRVSGGVVHFATESPLEPPEMLAAKVTRITGGFVEPAMSSVLAGDAKRALDWLRAKNARFAPMSSLPRQRWVMAPLRLPRPALDPNGWRGRAGDAMLKLLTDHLRKRQGEIALGTKAQRLIIEGGRCVGVAASHGD